MILFVSMAVLTPISVHAGTKAQVAIYNGNGTWADGIVAFTKFLDYKGITWQYISASTINKQSWETWYDAIYFPGGYSADYKSAITTTGMNKIRSFVNNGGRYIGICAGAFFACDKVDWEGRVYDYPLKLFLGRGYGAIDQIIPWSGYTMTTVNINKNNPINQYEPATETILYYGGPAFYPNQGQQMNVIATWQAYNNDPAIINFNYGNGRVLLVGPHPEIEEDSTRDGTSFGDAFNDLGTDWNLLWTSVDWVMGLPISRPPDLPETEPPIIRSANDSPDPCASGNPITITANVTDNAKVESVWVNIGGINYSMALNGNLYSYTHQTSGGSAETFFDGFESIFSWSTYGTGNPWIVSTDSPYSGTYCARAKQTGAGNSAYLEKGISTAGFTGITVSYYRMIIGFDVADEFSAQWFDGTSWHNLEALGSNSENDASYIYKQFVLPNGADNNPNFKIRFMADCGAVSEMAYVDNVRITATLPSMSPGTYGYTVYAKDTSGNYATPVTGSFVIQ
jgi:glutamine amidotransferase-like uncharacterized protein